MPRMCNVQSLEEVDFSKWTAVKDEYRDCNNCRCQRMERTVSFIEKVAYVAFAILVLPCLSSNFREAFYHAVFESKEVVLFREVPNGSTAAQVAKAYANRGNDVVFPSTTPVAQQPSLRQQCEDPTLCQSIRFDDKTIADCGFASWTPGQWLVAAKNPSFAPAMQAFFAQPDSISRQEFTAEMIPHCGLASWTQEQQEDATNNFSFQQAYLGHFGRVYKAPATTEAGGISRIVITPENIEQVVANVRFGSPEDWDSLEDNPSFWQNFPYLPESTDLPLTVDPWQLIRRRKRITNSGLTQIEVCQQKLRFENFFFCANDTAIKNATKKALEALTRQQNSYFATQAAALRRAGNRP